MNFNQFTPEAKINFWNVFYSSRDYYSPNKKTVDFKPFRFALIFIGILTHCVLLIFLFWDLGMVRSLLGRLCQLLRSEEAIGKHTIGPLVVRFQADALFQQWNGSGAVTTFPREVSLRRFSSDTKTFFLCFYQGVLILIMPNRIVDYYSILYIFSAK